LTRKASVSPAETSIETSNGSVTRAVGTKRQPSLGQIGWPLSVIRASTPSPGKGAGAATKGS
jgi:hypothetical protein